MLAMRFFLLLALLVPTSGLAHSYKFVGAGDATYEFVDTATLQRAPTNTVTAWILLVNSPAFMMQGKLIRYGLYQNAYDCAKRTVRPIYGIAYGTTKDALKEWGAYPAIPAIPDSIGEEALDAACNPSALKESIPLQNVDAAISFADFTAKNAHKVP